MLVKVIDFASNKIITIEQAHYKFTDEGIYRIVSDSKNPTKKTLELTRYKLINKHYWDDKAQTKAS